jgi:hypothetical protein
MSHDALAEGSQSTVNSFATGSRSGQDTTIHSQLQLPPSTNSRPPAQRQGSDHTWFAAQDLCNYAAAERTVVELVASEASERHSKHDHRLQSYSEKYKESLMQERDILRSVALTRLVQMTTEWPGNGQEIQNLLNGLDVGRQATEDFISALLAKSEQSRSRRASKAAKRITQGVDSIKEDKP